MPQRVQPEQAKNYRWEVLSRASQRHINTPMLLLEILQNIGAVTNNSIISYISKINTEQFDALQLNALLHQVVDKLDQEEFNLLLWFLKDEKQARALIKSRPKMLYDDQILGIDFKGLSKEPLSKLLNTFRLIRTNFGNIPKVTAIPIVSEEEAGKLIGSLKLPNGMSLNKYLEIIATWSEKNSGANVYLSDPGLQCIICETSDGQQFSIIDYIRKFLQPLNPALANIRFVPETVFSDRLQHNIAEEHEAAGLNHNQDDYYTGKELQREKFYAPVQVDDAGLAIAYNETLRTANDFSDYLPHPDHPIIFHFDSARPTVDASVAGTIAPALGLIGVYQGAYAAAANKGVIRNAFKEYQKRIANLEDQEIAKILTQYPNPIDQIAQIKLKAKNKLITSILHETLYAGTTGSIFLGSILALVLGPFAPFSLIPTFVGVAITGLAALRNKSLLKNKIDAFIDSEQVDYMIVEKLQSYKRGESSINPEFSNKMLYRASLTTTFITYITRLAGIASFAVVAVAPIIFSIAATLHAAISWKSTNLHLRKMRANPIASLNSSKIINIEEVTITGFSSARNEFMRYLFNVKGADSIKMMLDEVEIKVTSSSKFEQRLRYFLSAIGLTETDRNNRILEALYDASNPNANALREKLQSECMQMVFNRRMEAHLKKYGKALNLKATSLHELQEQYKNGHKGDYNKLYIDFLKTTTENNVANTINLTGFSTVGIITVIFATSALIFPPIGPFALAGVPILLLAGYGLTKLFAHYEKKRMRKAIATISEAELQKIVASKDNTSFLPLTRKLYNTHPQPKKAGSVAQQNGTPSIRTRLPTHFDFPKKYADNLQMSLRHICNGISTPKASAKADQQFFITEDKKGKMDIFLLSHKETPESIGSHNNLLTVEPAKNNAHGEPIQNVSLHQGTAIGWQVFLVVLTEIHKTGCDISFGNNLSEQLAEERAKDFIQAMLAEFATNRHLTCRLKLQFDAKSALAVYKVLQNEDFINKQVTYNKADLDKVRSHFGLELNDGELKFINKSPSGGEFNTFIKHKPPLQNINIFTTHMPFINKNLGSQHKQLQIRS